MLPSQTRPHVHLLNTEIFFLWAQTGTDTQETFRCQRCISLHPNFCLHMGVEDSLYCLCIGEVLICHVHPLLECESECAERKALSISDLGRTGSLGLSSLPYL